MCEQANVVVGTKERYGSGRRENELSFVSYPPWLATGPLPLQAILLREVLGCIGIST